MRSALGPHTLSSTMYNPQTYQEPIRWENKTSTMCFVAMAIFLRAYFRFPYLHSSPGPEMTLSGSGLGLRRYVWAEVLLWKLPSEVVVEAMCRAWLRSWDGQQSPRPVEIQASKARALTLSVRGHLIVHALRATCILCPAVIADLVGQWQFCCGLPASVLLRLKAW